VSASVNLPLHHKVQKFSFGTGSPGWSWKKGSKTVMVVVVPVFFGMGHSSRFIRGKHIGHGISELVIKYPNKDVLSVM